MLRKTRKDIEKRHTAHKYDVAWILVTEEEKGRNFDTFAIVSE